MKRCPNCGRQFPDDANFCPADAGRLEPDAGDTHRGVPPVGASTGVPAGEGPLGGRFETGAQIGGGLTGEVFQARDTQSGQPCAVKLVQSRVFPNQLMLQRAERELKQLERVQLTEVAGILGHGRKGDRLWIAMEWVEGAPLDRLVAQSGPMPAARAAALVRSVAQGLAEVAKQGVIHRDLAAKNILVGSGDSVKVVNFSIAVPYSDKVQGVPEFLSPEQIDGKPADQRSSIYSLGALLYFAVTGRPPFTGDPETVHRAHQSGEVIRPSQIAGTPENIDAIILKAMEKHSARRFMTLHQLMSELDAFASGAAHLPVAHNAQMGKSKGMAPVGAGAGATLMGVSGFGPPPGVGQPPSPLFDTPGVAGHQVAAHQVPTMLAGQAPNMPVAQPGLPLSHQPTVPDPAPPQAPVVISKASLPPSASMPNMPTTGKKGKGKGGAPAESKGKFRETMWFKKGELDEAAAAAAAAAHEGELALDKADALPIEDRYKDDGTLSRQDAERFSLRTGATSMMQSMRDPNAAAVGGRRGKGLSESDMVGEMKSGRTMLILAIVLGIAAAVGIIVYFTT